MTTLENNKTAKSKKQITQIHKYIRIETSIWAIGLGYAK